MGGPPPKNLGGGATLRGLLFARTRSETGSGLVYRRGHPLRIATALFLQTTLNYMKNTSIFHPAGRNSFKSFIYNDLYDLKMNNHFE